MPSVGSTYLEESKVIDCDVHVTHSSTALVEKRAEHLDEPYRSVLLDYHHNDDASTYPQAGFATRVPKQPSSETIRDVDDIVDPLCGELNIDDVIVNTLIKVDFVPETERAVQEMKASNEVLEECFLDLHDSVHGLFQLTTRDPDAAASEISRLSDNDNFVGAMVINGATEKPLGHDRYNPIYAAAERHGVPIVFHSSGKLPGHPDHHFELTKLEKWMPIHTLVHPLSHIYTITSLITNGVPEKFPDLDFVFLEGGLSWIPGLMFRLNREYDQNRWDAPLLNHPPEHYVREFYFGTQPFDEPMNDEHIRSILEIIGPDSLLFTTDHPHYDFDHPPSLEKYFGGFSEDELDRMFWENAHEVFGV